MRLAIANDNPTIVEGLINIIASISIFEVDWVAQTGGEALQKCISNRPHILLIDLDLPHMNGVETIFHIMRNCPCAILIMTKSIEENSRLIFEAMGYGALDAVNYPNFNLNEDIEGAKNLLRKIRNIATLIDKKASASYNGKKVSFKHSNLHSKKIFPPLLVIGASTGGPEALVKILSFLPKSLQVATVVVQHMDEQFAPHLVSWLGKQTTHAVTMAVNGSCPAVGKILVAGTNKHLVFNSKLELTYTDQPVDNAYHPSVDVFFTSVALYWPHKSVAVLLTGMGSDGAQGLKKLREKGWHTIAQHEEDCVIYGMPKVAVEINAASEVLKLEEIASAISSRIYSFYTREKYDNTK